MEKLETQENLPLWIGKGKQTSCRYISNAFWENIVALQAHFSKKIVVCIMNHASKNNKCLMQHESQIYLLGKSWYSILCLSFYVYYFNVMFVFMFIIIWGESLNEFITSFYILHLYHLWGKMTENDMYWNLDAYFTIFLFTIYEI